MMSAIRSACQPNVPPQFNAPEQISRQRYGDNAGGAARSRSSTDRRAPSQSLLQNHLRAVLPGLLGQRIKAIE
jgi:hypothetical protein